MDKLTHIFRVIKSCKLPSQIESTKRWALRLRLDTATLTAILAKIKEQELHINQRSCERGSI